MAVEADTGRPSVLRRDTVSDTPNAVAIIYARPPLPDVEHRLVCRYGGSGFAAGRLTLTGVELDRRGTALSPVRLHMLRVWLGLFDQQRRTAVRDAAGGTAAVEAVYLLQQLINAIVLSCCYGLLAIGYTVVYGLIERINLAFGELAMVGGMTTILGVTAYLALGGGAVLPIALLSVLFIAMLNGAVYGWTTERMVFRPMRSTTTQAPLIATIGLAVALQEYVRLVQGSRDHWLQPAFSDSVVLADAQGLTASISLGQMLVFAATAGLFGALLAMLKRSGFGLRHRACADDMGMAALLGVDVNRTVAVTFIVGGSFAAAAGVVLTIYYGFANFFMGHMIGFKALTAAIVGGIGSVPGAMLGGLLIGLVETLWSGYLPIAYKDIAVFGLLTTALIFRPQGLLGHSPPADRRVPRL